MRWNSKLLFHFFVVCEVSDVWIFDEDCGVYQAFLLMETNGQISPQMPVARKFEDLEVWAQSLTVLEAPTPQKGILRSFEWRCVHCAICPSMVRSVSCGGEKKRSLLRVRVFKGDG